MERTPYEEQELVERLDQFVKAADERAAKRRWLVTLRSKDGLELHKSIVGDPPRYLNRFLDEGPYTTYLSEPERAEAKPTKIREYCLKNRNSVDGTALYIEV